MRCSNPMCEAWLNRAEFTYLDRPFCCGCMSAICSWLLDGGVREDPALFASLYVDPAVDADGDEPGDSSVTTATGHVAGR